MSRKHRHKHRLPERSGSHLAGKAERAKARAIYGKPKAGTKAEPKADTMQTIPAPAPTTRRSRQGVYLTPEQHQWLEGLVAREGFDRIAEWLSGLPRAHLAQTGPHQWGRATLRSLRKVSRHDARGLSVFHELRENYGKPHQATDPQIRVVTQERTDLVGAGAWFDPKLVQFNGSTLRVLLDGGEPLFIAKDLVEAVGATWRGADGVAHIPEEYRGARSVRTPSGDQRMVVLTEAGVNMYLFRSDKPAALPWQKHLAEVVLPSIRKTGRYESPKAAAALPPANDQLLSQLLVNSQEQTRALTALTTAIASMDRPRRYTKPENPAQQPLSLAQRQRKALEDLVRSAAGVDHFTPPNEFHDLVRAKWHELYAHMKREANVDVLRGTAACNARNETNAQGNRMGKIDYLEKSGNMALALEIALKLWG